MSSRQHDTTKNEEKHAALQVCLDLLESLKMAQTDPQKARETFIEHCSPFCTAYHSRVGTGLVPPIQHEANPQEFADRMPWFDGIYMAEPLDGEPTIMVDRDLAMVWTPFYVIVGDNIRHFGTNCFTLLNFDWDSLPDKNGTHNKQADPHQSKKTWKVTSITDTARLPTDEDLKRVGWKGRPSS